MKKMKIGISISLTIFILILSVLLLVFSCGSGQRCYRSKLSNIELQLPAFSLFVEELQDENTYTVQFKMLGREEHIISELQKIENKNDENPVYAIEQWALSESAPIVKTVTITYGRK